MNFNGSGIIWLIVGILAIVALVVFIWINVNISEDPAAIIAYLRA